MASSLAQDSGRSLRLSLPPTRFAGCDRRLAAGILVVTVLAMLLLLAAGVQYQAPKGAGSAGDGDMAMYTRIVERMHAGAGYYSATHAELSAGGYGTRSVFNWRLPTLAWLESLLPSLAWSSVILGVAAAGAIFAVSRFARLTADGATQVMTIIALAASLFACATPAAALFTEIPAGVLILASVAAYGLSRWRVGFALALAALFVRELAAFYVLVCVYLALRANRRDELAAWAAGLIAFSAFFAWHYAMVQSMVTPGDHSYATGWIQFGGLPFLLSAMRFNGIFMAMPLWVTAVLAPLCLLGLAAWPASRRAVAAIGVYLIAFAIIGKPFNDYWGAMFTPVMMLGLAFVPAALRDLATAPASPSPPPRAA
jgi:hypothetical protein